MDPRLSMFPSALPGETSTVSGPQNILLLLLVVIESVDGSCNSKIGNLSM